ncbi:putative cell-wall binding lipoprotein [Thermolongibacillus altinsuensis]|uniref:Putative cell-wall binding lipoprotein n=1 Tax=Thermolongibacillus altinsuensis TaxID=575256 RepID=A0A4R1QE86_9BACL|nr:YkyA family protein [Thermolongibacillus altinsuensis]TCL50213.1 putative cell-wall binding lipoprotein [Thermolongibacillus altinsuensis]
MSFRQTLFFSILLIVLTSCSINSPERELKSLLNEVNQLEQSFAKHQQPLIELEKKEKEIYEEIMSLGLKQFDQIQPFVKEALQVIDQRKKRMDEERKNMVRLKDEMANLQRLIDQIDDPTIKSEARNVYELWEKRYRSYEQLYQYYHQALQLESQFYHLLQEKDLTFVELEEKINEINKTYERFQKMIEQYNDYTNQYNKAKKTLYSL